jgi:hypothetical protein
MLSTSRILFFFVMVFPPSREAAEIFPFPYLSYFPPRKCQVYPKKVCKNFIFGAQKLPPRSGIPFLDFILPLWYIGCRK